MKPLDEAWELLQRGKLNLPIITLAWELAQSATDADPQELAILTARVATVTEDMLEATLPLARGSEGAYRTHAYDTAIALVELFAATAPWEPKEREVWRMRMTKMIDDERARAPIALAANETTTMDASF